MSRIGVNCNWQPRSGRHVRNWLSAACGLERLLLNESSTFTTAFVFSKGQFDCEDLDDAVWDTTRLTP